MKTPSISNARFVRDEISRVLALSDAVASENPEVITAAFLDIACSRGIAQIAFEAELSENAIYAALVVPGQPDTIVLRQIVNSMLRRLSQNDHGEPE